MTKILLLCFMIFIVKIYSEPISEDDVFLEEKLERVEKETINNSKERSEFEYETEDKKNILDEELDNIDYDKEITRKTVKAKEFFFGWYEIGDYDANLVEKVDIDINGDGEDETIAIINFKNYMNIPNLQDFSELFILKKRAVLIKDLSPYKLTNRVTLPHLYEKNSLELFDLDGDNKKEIILKTFYKKGIEEHTIYIFRLTFKDKIWNNEFSKWQTRYYLKQIFYSDILSIFEGNRVERKIYYKDLDYDAKQEILVVNYSNIKGKEKYSYSVYKFSNYRYLRTTQFKDRILQNKFELKILKKKNDVAKKHFILAKKEFKKANYKTARLEFLKILKLGVKNNDYYYKAKLLIDKIDKDILSKKIPIIIGIDYPWCYINLGKKDNIVHGSRYFVVEKNGIKNKIVNEIRVRTIYDNESKCKIKKERFMNRVVKGLRIYRKKDYLIESNTKRKEYSFSKFDDRINILNSLGIPNEVINKSVNIDKKKKIKIFAYYYWKKGVAYYFNRNNKIITELKFKPESSLEYITKSMRKRRERIKRVHKNEIINLIFKKR